MKQRYPAELIDSVGNLGINAGAGNGQAQVSVAVDKVQGKGRPVPQGLDVGKAVGVRPEIFEEVVAGAGGDHRHGGVGIPGDAVGHFAGGPIPAAGIEPDRFPACAVSRARDSAPPGQLVSRQVQESP